jgi:hypothetical protein
MKRPENPDRRRGAGRGLITALGAVLTLACAQQQPYYPQQPGYGPPPGPPPRGAGPQYQGQQQGYPPPRQAPGQYPPPGYPQPGQRQPPPGQYPPPQRGQYAQPGYPQQPPPPGYPQQPPPPGYPPQRQQYPQQAQYPQRPGYPPQGGQPPYGAAPGYPPGGPGYGQQPDAYGYADPYADPTAYSHDGFYLRGGLGLDFLTFDSAGVASVGLDVAVGGMVIPNLAIFGDVNIAFNRHSSIGAGVAYYLMPLNMYFGGGLALGAARGYGGVAFRGQVGKEWFVAPQFGIGVGGTLGVGFMEGRNPLSVAINFISTFN